MTIEAINLNKRELLKGCIEDIMIGMDSIQMKSSLTVIEIGLAGRKYALEQPCT